MRSTITLFAFGLGLLATPALAAVSGKAPAVLASAVDEVILPGYRAFDDRTGRLEEAMKALCTDPSAEAEAAAREAFADTLKAWGPVEIIRSGPALEKNRFERVLYHPDRKGIALKQIQAILSKKDESATAVETLSGKSVGVQGLGALEFVLYGKGHETLQAEKASHRCRYGAAIAGNLHAIAGEFVAAWQAPGGIATSWKTPGPQNPAFRTEEEAVVELLGIMVHGAEMVRDQRIRAFAGEKDAKANPKQAIFWRSGNTWTMIGADIDGLIGFWKKAGMEDLLADDQRSVGTSIAFVMKAMARTARSVSPDIELALSEPEERARIDFLMLNGRDLITRLSDDYGRALGLGAGFSFSDGD
ncbi:imelysin family protein [Gellertiella hungarica]|uniref:Imelysin-like domain-containing protein n=1 Tax=Gellertiella hungarica TaxID=1572859 RepID=A0A7W6NJH0_9HYPH|nr:imelysin family protein [Gellertiella hungarica]MBB4063728.1 hypothetical protein [Gellertiella hungarica]